MNIKNRTLYIADNLNIMRNIDPEVIDLIYLDPPFNTKKQYKAPIGSKAEGASFKDIWTDEDVKHEWYGEVAEQNPELYQVIQAAETLYDKSMKIYLMAMAIRLFEMHRILKPTGSIYLHCDSTASHYLKLIMDSIFGKKHFRNEIVWERIKGAGKTSQHSPRSWGRSSDSLLWYSKNNEHQFNSDAIKAPYSEEYLAENFPQQDSKGRYKRRSPFRPPGLGARPNLCYEYKGFIPPHPSGWTVSKSKLQTIDNEGGLEITPNGKIHRKQRPDGMIPNNIWTDILPTAGNERTGYPTQKPLALLERIIKASSNEGDMVFDPFCGCATACVAAENLGRQWVGIDMSESAEVITKLRLQDEIDKGTDLWNPIEDITVSRTPPPLTHPTPETQIPINSLFNQLTPPDYSQAELQAFHSHKHRVYGNQEGRCNGCKHPLPFRNMTIDHIRPKSKNGTDEPHNLQLLCGACNSTKGNRSQKFLIDTLEKQFIR